VAEARRPPRLVLGAPIRAHPTCDAQAIGRVVGTLVVFGVVTVIPAVWAVRRRSRENLFVAVVAGDADASRDLARAVIVAGRS